MKKSIFKIGKKALLFSVFSILFIWTYTVSAITWPTTAPSWAFLWYWNDVKSVLWVNTSTNEATFTWAVNAKWGLKENGSTLSSIYQEDIWSDTCDYWIKSIADNGTVTCAADNDTDTDTNTWRPVPTCTWTQKLTSDWTDITCSNDVDTNTDTNTWNANSKSVAWYVSAPWAVANKVWKTDSSWNPAWRESIDINDIISKVWDSYLYFNGRSCNSSNEGEYNPWTGKTCGAIIATNVYSLNQLVINWGSWMSWTDTSFQAGIFPSETNATFYCSKINLSYSLSSWRSSPSPISSWGSYTKNGSVWDNRWWCWNDCISEIVCEYDSYGWQ